MNFGSLFFFDGRLLDVHSRCALSEHRLRQF